MTQYQFDTIMKLIVNGAPALADELCNALATVVNERNDFKNELDELKKNENSKEEE